jgi:hypothetical protein
LARMIHQFGDPLFSITALSRETEVMIEAIAFGAMGSIGLIGWHRFVTKSHRRPRQILTPMLAVILLAYLGVAHYTATQRSDVTQRLVREFTRGH